MSCLPWQHLFNKCSTSVQHMLNKCSTSVQQMYEQNRTNDVCVCVSVFSDGMVLRARGGTVSQKVPDMRAAWREMLARAGQVDITFACRCIASESNCMQMISMLSIARHCSANASLDEYEYGIRIRNQVFRFFTRESNTPY